MEKSLSINIIYNVLNYLDTNDHYKLFNYSFKNKYIHKYLIQSQLQSEEDSIDFFKKQLNYNRIIKEYFFGNPNYSSQIINFTRYSVLIYFDHQDSMLYVNAKMKIILNHEIENILFLTENENSNKGNNCFSLLNINKSHYDQYLKNKCISNIFKSIKEGEIVCYEKTDEIKSIFIIKEIFNKDNFDYNSENISSNKMKLFSNYDVSFEVHHYKIINDYNLEVTNISLISNGIINEDRIYIITAIDKNDYPITRLYLVTLNKNIEETKFFDDYLTNGFNKSKYIKEAKILDKAYFNLLTEIKSSEMISNQIKSIDICRINKVLENKKGCDDYFNLKSNNWFCNEAILYINEFKHISKYYLDISKINDSSNNLDNAIKDYFIKHICFIKSSSSNYIIDFKLSSNDIHTNIDNFLLVKDSSLSNIIMYKINNENLFSNDICYKSINIKTSLSFSNIFKLDLFNACDFIIINNINGQEFKNFKNNYIVSINKCLFGKSTSYVFYKKRMIKSKKENETIYLLDSC